VINDNTVMTIAAQPAGREDPQVAAAARLLTWARCSIMNPGADVPEDPCGYFTEERLELFHRARNLTLTKLGL